jgi:hypothetical protein
VAVANPSSYFEFVTFLHQDLIEVILKVDIGEDLGFM